LNTVFWLIAGGLVAAVTFQLLHLNSGRGLVVAVVIGALTAYVGGNFLTPLFGAPAGAEFHPVALVIASCTAFVALFFSDGIYERFGR
jgi:uncharacterized membrane protein YeaQ/YmgE (transglycosylase-associated protein family)